jgi:predicted lipid-binding transport protein (Tim44 family)
VLNLGPQGGQLFDALFGAIKIGLVGALHEVFMVAAVLGVIGLLITLLLKELPLRKTYAPSTDVTMSDTAAQVGKDAFPSLPPLRPEDQPAVGASREKGLVA